MAASPSLAALAWRNIWRNRRRTLITLFGIAFGVLLAVVATGLGDAAYAKMIDYAAKMGGGHVTVQHSGYLEAPSPKKTVRVPPGFAERATDHPRVQRSVERVAGAAMLATAANSYGAFFMAIDPAREDKETLVFLGALTEGEMLADAGDKGIVLGATLAENLDVGLGKKVVITLTDKHGEIVSGLARVRGIVKTGAASLDGGLAIIGIDRAREWLGYEADEVTQLAIFASDERAAAPVADFVGERAPPDSAVLTWQETAPDLAGYIGMERNATWIMEAFIMVLMAAGIFNTLFVGVMERLREFGIMRALGFTRGQLFGLVMWESLWVGVSGLVFAALVTTPLYYYWHTTGIDYSAFLGEGVESIEVAGVAMLDTVFYLDIYGSHLLIICALVLAATLGAGLYPAYQAGRVPPAEAIRLI